MKKLVSLGMLSAFLLAACNTTPVDSTPQMLGNPNAPILVEEFSDPQCPACAAVSPQVEKIILENPDLARMEYYHFPLSFHKHAFLTAQATECAADQGMFWEYLGQVFETQANLSEDHLYSLANSLELDETQFDECLSSGKYKSKVRAHQAEGSRRNVRATPTIFVNGEMIRWSGPETFKAYLESL